jgi:PAS domain S-box-containing protein
MKRLFCVGGLRANPKAPTLVAPGQRGLAHTREKCMSKDVCETATSWSLEEQLAECQRQLSECRRHALLESAERKLTEESLRETKAALEFTLRAGQIGDWDLDLLNDTSRRSLRHDRCFGYDTAIAEHQWGIEVFIRHVHPEDRVRVEGSLRAAVQSQSDWRSEFRVVWPDASVHWLMARGSMYRTSEGRAARMLGVVIDITERKKWEEATRTSAQLSRGHVAALESTVEALASESDPERLAGHILRTMTQQFGAHSSSAWCRDDATGMIGFEFAFEDGRVVTKGDRRFMGMDLWLPMADVWPWPEVFDAGKPSLIEDIRNVPPFALRDRLLPLGIISVLLIPMWTAGRLAGAIGLRFTEKRSFRSEEMDLARALANQAMLMIQFARLSAQSQRVAVIAERNRIAREIHDTLAQGFTGVIVQLEAAEDARLRGFSQPADEHSRRAVALARESLNEARRSVRALRPRALDDRGLSAALHTLFQEMTQGTLMKAEFSTLGQPTALPQLWEDNLFRVAQEISTNALRHAQAKLLTARLVFVPGCVQLDLTDDGRGFDPTMASDGYGLLGIRERVEGMGGRIEVRSARGQGTTVLIRLPVPEPLEGWGA